MNEVLQRFKQSLVETRDIWIESMENCGTAASEARWQDQIEVLEAIIKALNLANPEP